MFRAPHMPHNQAVGGTVPGYAGHRPAAFQTHGETAWGGVPQHLADEVPGQGFSLPATTAFSEIGQPYKPHVQDRTDQFRSSVGGIKVGYGGHVPGHQNHFGSNHQGNVPRHDASPQVFIHGSPPRPPTEGEIRKAEFEPARHLAQATGTARQHHEVHGAGRVAPFGLDHDNAPYITETTRVNGAGGPRGQVMARNSLAPSSDKWPRGNGPAAQQRGRHAASPDSVMFSSGQSPGAVAAGLYQRDVHGVRSCNASQFVYSPPSSGPSHSGPSHSGVYDPKRGGLGPNPDLHGTAKIGLQHAPHPSDRGGSRLNQFLNGAGQMDDVIDAPTGGFAPPPGVTHAAAVKTRVPSHAYETQQQQHQPNNNNTPPPTAHRGYGSTPRTAEAKRNQSRMPLMAPASGASSPPANPFSSRLLGAMSPHHSQRSPSATPPVTPPLTPTSRSQGRASGTRYATDPVGQRGHAQHGTPGAMTRQPQRTPSPSPQQQQTFASASLKQAAWQAVPSMRGERSSGNEFLGRGARPASPRAWRREPPEEQAWLYEA